MGGGRDFRRKRDRPRSNGVRPISNARACQPRIIAFSPLLAFWRVFRRARTENASRVRPTPRTVFKVTAEVIESSGRVFRNWSFAVDSIHTRLVVGRRQRKRQTVADSTSRADLIRRNWTYDVFEICGLNEKPRFGVESCTRSVFSTEKETFPLNAKQKQSVGSTTDVVIDFWSDTLGELKTSSSEMNSRAREIQLNNPNVFEKLTSSTRVSDSLHNGRIVSICNRDDLWLTVECSPCIHMYSSCFVLTRVNDHITVR